MVIFLQRGTSQINYSSPQVKTKREFKPGKFEYFLFYSFALSLTSLVDIEKGLFMFLGLITSISKNSIETEKRTLQTILKRIFSS